MAYSYLSRGVRCNYISIYTQGLHPESHGIVANSFYDTKLKDKFKISGATALESKWWKGEPVGWDQG